MFCSLNNVQITARSWHPQPFIQSVAAELNKTEHWILFSLYRP